MTHRLMGLAMALAILARAQVAGEAARLAPTGTLRATFLANNSVQGKVDPKSGEVSGPAADIVRELARRLAVPYRISAKAGVRAVMDSVLQREADVGFLAFDATRAAEVDFTQSYELAFNTYVVRTDSALQTVAGSDREGVRIAAPKGDSGDLYLNRTLKHAELRSIPGLGVDEAQKLLAAKEIDAFATNRQRLVQETARFPDLRVLPDNFYAVEQALIVTKGEPSRLEFLNRVLDDLRKSGFIQAAIDRAHLHGVEVAPSGTRAK